jgi:hypothetical protein
MDSVAEAIVLHADRALRQLPLDAQREALEALRGRVETRATQTPQRRQFEAHRCGEKRRYATRDEAERARLEHKNAIRLESYGCGCGGFHLGHKR